MLHYEGLSPNEVEKSRNLHGSNQLAEPPGESFFGKLRDNLKDPIIKILLLALAINVVFALLGQTDWLQTAGIAFAVTLSTAISSWSEFSNEAAFKKTQSDAQKIQSKVFRAGGLREVPIDEIVKGDLILLQSGDMVPADGMLVEGALYVNQAALNGESEEAQKNVPPAGWEVIGNDTFNGYYLFRGTVVASGEGVLNVHQVGIASLYGQMADELHGAEMESPLKEKLRGLAALIAKIGYAAGILVFISVMLKNIVNHNGFDPVRIRAYLRDYPVFLMDFLEAVILGVIIVVVAVPEGLPLMIALVLSLNMKKMLKANVLVRKMMGIETSGNLNILYSDKTGTITRGILEVVTFLDGTNKKYGSYKEVPPGLRKMLKLSVHYNTNAVITEALGGTNRIMGGNATEKAVLDFVGTLKGEGEGITRIHSVPFSSERKFSATKIGGTVETTLIKGAPETILPYCTSRFDAQGNIQPFVEFRQLNDEINELASRSIRVLALAVTDGEITEKSLPASYTLIGLLGIRDEVRPEAVEAIGRVQSAGIQVVMITGDRKETAVAIAKDAGILRFDTDIVLTSETLNEMSDAQIKEILPSIRVVSRALPMDKSRLVRISQELGLVCGMTGDGVNDGPALKRADVGFAMGSGTEAAKEAGDIVILDDNFKSIAHAILYGRTIYRSIQKFITFQLTLNLAALATNFLAPFLDLPSPLTIIQMLWVNLVMDSLGALAFGGEPVLEKYMWERPKKRTDKIVTFSMWAAILISSASLTFIGIWMLTSPTAKSWFIDERHLYTGYFGFFILFAVVNAFNARTNELNILENIRKNTSFLKIMALIIAVQIGMIFIGGEVLRTVPITPREWGIVLSLALLALPIGTLRKLVFNRPPKNKPNLEIIYPPFEGVHSLKKNQQKERKKSPQ